MGTGRFLDMFRARRGKPDQPRTDDAFQALDSVAGWVTAAETKTGLLATALTVLAGVVASKRAQALASLQGELSCREVAVLIPYGVCLMSLVASGAFLVAALRARTEPGAPSRFAFPYLATADIDKLMTDDGQEIRREAWSQAQTLARIAMRKYKHFNVALTLGLVSAGTFVVWLFVAPVPMP